MAGRVSTSIQFFGRCTLDGSYAVAAARTGKLGLGSLQDLEYAEHALPQLEAVWQVALSENGKYCGVTGLLPDNQSVACLFNDKGELLWEKQFPAAYQFYSPRVGQACLGIVAIDAQGNTVLLRQPDFAEDDQAGVPLEDIVEDTAVKANEIILIEPTGAIKQRQQVPGVFAVFSNYDAASQQVTIGFCGHQGPAGYVAVWDIGSGRLVREWRVSQPLVDGACLSDGTILTVEWKHSDDPTTPQKAMMDPPDKLVLTCYQKGQEKWQQTHGYVTMSYSTVLHGCDFLAVTPDEQIIGILTGEPLKGRYKLKLLGRDGQETGSRPVGNMEEHGSQIRLLLLTDGSIWFSNHWVRSK